MPSLRFSDITSICDQQHILRAIKVTLTFLHLCEHWCRSNTTTHEEREMLSFKNIKTQAVALSIAGTFSLASFLGPVSSTASAATNFAPTPSFENATLDNHWTTQLNGTNSVFAWNSSFGHDGNRSVTILGSKPGNKGWPGFQTTEAIPVDPQKEYVFSAWNHSNSGSQGSPWMDIAIYNSAGKYVGGVSTGTSSVLKASNEWHKQILNFKPAALGQYFPDISSVKLGLRLSLNYDVVGYPEGKKTGITYDQVSFESRTREPAGFHSQNPKRPSRDRTNCMGLPATIIGTQGNDILHGTSGNDVIVGLGGNDTVYGNGGNDIICGGDGDDRLMGMDGYDRIFGENGNDRISGGEGLDYLLGGAGDDIIFGGNGDDLIRGGAGKDQLYGSAGNDRITGGYHNDGIKGGAGDDRLSGNDGVDRLDGGEGSDYLDGGAEIDGCINGETYVSCGT